MCTPKLSRSTALVARTALIAASIGLGAPPVQAQVTVEQRALLRPESDTLLRAPHGRRLDEPAVSDRPFAEVGRFRAPEASQGVAVDERNFYAVGNSWIAKYDRETGQRVSEWRGNRNGPVIHLNSCLAQGGQLVCAHSNHPGIPMLSSIEIWDTETLEHVGSHSFGAYEGSLTWAIPRDGDWWLNFAHYGNYSGTPGKGSEWTTLVRFDSSFQRLEGYAYPVALIDRLTPNSLSGGNWGEDGRLYVTGHDDPEVYVLELPAMGSVLEWVETIPAPMHGQAWVFDPTDSESVWGIVRATREVVVGRRR